MAAAAFLGVLVVFAIIWRVAEGAWPAIKVFHLNFLWDNVWNAPLNEYGARDLIIGTIVTSFGAILLAAPLSIAIGLFLSELAPPWIRTPVGTLVDMLAAVPSVVIGLWGIYVLAPFNAQHVQPAISAVLGWLPIFANGEDKVESTVFSAMIVLTIMIIPITSSICRELFIGVPSELGGIDRARCDALGDGEDGRRPVGARRRRRGGHPWPRTSARRGDRRDAGDRQLHPAEANALRSGRHDREWVGRTSTKVRPRTSRSRR